MNEEELIENEELDKESTCAKIAHTSERMFYQKITDIFAECSIDYDNTSELAREFYATIQNKFHYAITGETARNDEIESIVTHQQFKELEYKIDEKI